MNNLTAGNPVAHRIRVYYFGTSTIYEGMPVCYDNSTTNWWGGSVSNGEVTVSTTTAEGSQNEGKYIRVENPNTDNVNLFAGVVSKGGWVGSTGPKALDIYVPNGAVVPVRTDNNCLIDQTILAITTGSQELGVPLTTDSRPVAIARETVDRGTAGIVLAELNPARFTYQQGDGGTALSLDDADTTTGTTLNNVNIKFLGTANSQRGCYHVGEIAGAGGSLYGMWKFRTYINAALAANTHCFCANLHIKDAGRLTNAGGEHASAAIYATVETEVTTTAPNLSGGAVSAIYIGYYVDETTAAPVDAYPFYFNTNLSLGQWDGLFIVKNAADIAVTTSDGGVSTHKIPVKIAGTVRYLMLSDG